MSNFDDLTDMNLHEKYLLKYLVNPLELFYTTEMLKNNNLQLEKFCVNESDIRAESENLKVESYIKHI